MISLEKWSLTIYECRCCGSKIHAGKIIRIDGGPGDGNIRLRFSDDFPYSSYALYYPRSYLEELVREYSAGDYFFPNRPKGQGLMKKKEFEQKFSLIEESGESRASGY